LKGHTDSVNSVAWSADGRLASGSGDTVIIWDLKTGEPAQTLKGGGYSIEGVAWSADGNLASGSLDGNVILWDLKTGKPAQTFKEHWKIVASVAWSPDGRLASGSLDGTIKIARADLLHGNICNSIFRNMTLLEWSQDSFSIYHPACPNLYDPAHNITDALSVYIDILTLEIPRPVAILSVYSIWPNLAILSAINPIAFPADETTAGFLVTWQGRAILFGNLLLSLGIVALILWALYKIVVWLFRICYRLVSWILRKVRSQKTAAT